MKDYKVIATRYFRDSNEIDEKTGLKVERKINDIFYCTKERYEFLKENNAVKLIGIILEEKEEIVENYDNVDFEIEQEWCEEEKEYKEPQEDEVVEKIINKKKKRSKK